MVNEGLQWMSIVVLAFGVGSSIYLTIDVANHVRTIYTRIPRADLDKMVDDAVFKAQRYERAARDMEERTRVANQKFYDSAQAFESKMLTHLEVFRGALAELEAKQVKTIEYEIKDADVRKMVLEEIQANDVRFQDLLHEEIAKYDARCRVAIQDELKKTTKARKPTVQLVPNEITEPAGELPVD